MRRGELAGLLARMIDVPSPSGEEGAYADLVAGWLSGRGWDVRRQSVAPGRDNLLAVRGEPEVLFSTHLDVVPPHVPARVEDGTVFGRGACDTKGCLLAMIEAAGRLSGRAAERVGFLLVVGEEVDHCGAEAAARLGVRPRGIVLGEPTGNRMVRAQKGLARFRIVASGRGGHSGYPELGASAIHRLVGTLGRLVEEPWPVDPVRGETTLNVGTIAGGEAGNVIAASAEAEVVVRLVGDPEPVLAAVRRHLGEGVALEPISARGPLDLAVLDGFEETVIAFHSDAAWLLPLGAVHLMGPGDIRTAHSPDERIGLDELERGALLYERAARTILGER